MTTRHDDARRLQLTLLANLRSGAALGDPPEALNALEQGVWVTTLRAISEGYPSPAKLAATALLTKDIDFPRYTA